MRKDKCAKVTGGGKNLLLAAIAALGLSPWLAFSEPMTTSGACFLDTGWKFARFESEDVEPQNIAQDGFDISGWRSVRLPHDWGVEAPFRMDVDGSRGRLGFYGVGWYKTSFEVSETERLGRVFLDFDGAMSCATVYVNGRKLAFRPFGFISFRVDATKALTDGPTQTLAVRLDNRRESCRWYHGGGLYRRVRLVTTPEFHIAENSLCITTDVRDGAADVFAEIRTEGKDISGGEALARVRRAGEKDVLAECVGVKPEKKTDRFEFRLSLANPALWSPESPNLYEIEVLLSRDGETDVVRQVFGVRKVEFIPEKGMFLNGRHVKMRGVCQHSDTGALGVAAYRRAFERQLEILKEMGCNAIRTSHNPPSPDFLDLCDRMGFFVLDEAFDMWAMFKGGKDVYSRWFPDWWSRDLADMVRRDRNHPCVVMWSIGNEVMEQNCPEEALRLGAAMTALVHLEDPTRPVTMGNQKTYAMTNGLARAVDVYGCNYQPDRYGDFYAWNPNLGMVATETESMVSSRDSYFFPDDVDYGQIVRPQWKGMYDFQVSSYDLFPMREINYPPEVEFAAQRAFPQCYGNFVWTGFDYLGESYPYDRTNVVQHFRYSSPEKAASCKLFMESNVRGEPPGRSSYYGIIDLCGFPKDRYYAYQAEWRPDLPMAHLLPHWTWPGREGLITPVHAYTSGDEAELFLNGRSLGRRRKGDAFRLMWNDVRYEPGELRLVAWRDGKKWAETVRRTAGAPARLVASADRIRLTSLQDLSYVRIELQDTAGTVVPESDIELSFAVEGAVELAGVCNGDATDLTGLQTPRQKTFHGLCQAVVRAAEGRIGPGRLIVSGGGMDVKEDFVVEQ